MADIQEACDRAWDLFEEGEIEAALREARAALRNAGDDPLAADLCLIEALCLAEMVDFRGALAASDKGIRIDPEAADLHAERGRFLFELLRLDEAREALRASLRLSEGRDAAAHYWTALLAERDGDDGEARRHFREAARIDPDRFPKAVKMSDADFDAKVEEAVESLPERFREVLEKATITVEDIPSDADLRAEPGSLSPESLGLFRGQALGDGSVFDPYAFPPEIFLYRRNILRAARTPQEVVREIRTTVLHEVGHYLGLDEDDLAERGLE
ncbi:MAG: metallopeptidase family protein [Planctomycetes bacterium]|nr:metallopeptidase family protein [Planctomycetota bacterium]